MVLAKEEVSQVLGQMDGTPVLMAMLLYGAGLRLMDCCRLRIKDLDFSQNQIVVRSGKGEKDRVTLLPAAVKEPLRQHLREVKCRHEEDLRRGRGRVSLPYALERKYPNAGKEWSWQWVFPASSHYTDQLRDRGGGTTCTNRCSRRLLKKPGSRRGSRNRLAHTPRATRSLPVYLRMAMIFELFRNS